MIEIFQNQFMQNALVGGVLIGGVLAALGVFAVLRNQSLYADGIAHASLAGIALGIVVFDTPILWASIIAGVAAILITFIQTETKASFDSTIGVVYTLFFAIGIIILNSSDQYAPEITSYLFGSILLITKEKILITILISAITAIFTIFNYEKLAYMTFDEDAAKIRGVSTKLYSYLLNILIALAIVVGVNLLGIVLITSLLVVPALFAKSFSTRFKALIPTAIVFNTLSIITGLIVAYKLDLPSGATIVVVATGIYLLSLIVRRLTN